MKKIISSFFATAVFWGLAGCVEEGYLSFVQKASIVTASKLPFGPVEGGQTISLSGTEFTEKVAITLNDKPCANFLYISKSSVTCVTPSNPAGAYPIVVKTTSGGSSKNVSYTYQGIPTVSKITPEAMPVAGGREVSLAGALFMDGIIVTFNGTECKDVKVGAGGNALTCIAPPSTVGAATVVVKNLDKQASNPVNSLFFYNGIPEIIAATPASGPALTAQPVTITGRNFRPQMEVQIGGVACTDIKNIVISPVSGIHSVTCTRAAGPQGDKDIWLKTFPDNQIATKAAAYKYVPGPGISALVPSSGPDNAISPVSIVVQGQSFQGVKSVSIGGLACAITAQTSTTVTCTRATAAGGAGTKEVRLVNFDDQAINLPGAYTALAGPTLTSITPNKGPQSGNTSIVIGGASLRAGLSIKIGNVDCSSISGLSAATVTCRTGAQSTPGAKAIELTDEFGQKSTQTVTFTYDPPPMLVSIAPTNGWAAPTSLNDTLTLTGTNFVTGATVTVGDVPCTNPVVSSPTTLTCKRAAGSAGAKLVKLTNSDGQSTIQVVNFTNVPPPTLSNLTAATGSVKGGQVILVSGTDFQAGATASIGGQPCINKVTVNTTSSFRCETPAGIGTVVVQVTNGDGQKSGTVNYIYVVDNPSDGCATPAEYAAALAANNGTTFELKKNQTSTTFVNRVTTPWPASFQATMQIPIDIMFVQDITGSMSDTIQALATRLTAIVDDINSRVQGSTRFGLITYADWANPTGQIVSPGVNLNADSNANQTGGTAVKSVLSAIGAAGGGGEDEAGWSALHAVMNLSHAGTIVPYVGKSVNGIDVGWRVDSKKIAIVATDNAAQDPAQYTSEVSKISIAGGLVAANIKVLGLSIVGGEADPRPDLVEMATLTNSLRADNVTPMVFDLNRDGTAATGSTDDISSAIVNGIVQSITYEIGQSSVGAVAPDLQIGGILSKLNLRKDETGTFSLTFKNITTDANPARCIYRKITVANGGTGTEVISQSTAFIRLENYQ